jgi:hypothetical protein
MFLHKLLLLFEFLVVLVHIVLDLLLVDVLEDALHVLVVLGSWEFGQRNDLQLRFLEVAL